MRSLIRKSRITYASVYNFTFKNRSRLESNVRRRLSLTSSVRERLLFSRHYLTMFRTQTRAAPLLDSPMFSLVERQHRLAHLAAVITYLRPLQRFIIKYLYRPGGFFMRRSMRAALDE